MTRASPAVASQLLDSARYVEVAEPALALFAAGETARAQLLVSARELSLACRDRHDRVEVLCRRAGSEAVADTRIRTQLAALLERVSGGPGPDGAVGRAPAVHGP